MIVVGVDPGGRWTGVVVRDRRAPLAVTIVSRDEAGVLPGRAYLVEVLEAVEAAARCAGERDPHWRLAVEGLNPPTPHMGVTSVVGLMGAAMVLGAVLAVWPDARLVPPGGHGSAPLAVYPAELVGARERSGTGRLRHARSAWDVAAMVLRGVA